MAIKKSQSGLKHFVVMLDPSTGGSVDGLAEADFRCKAIQGDGTALSIKLGTTNFNVTELDSTKLPGAYQITWIDSDQFDKYGIVLLGFYDSGNTAAGLITFEVGGDVRQLIAADYNVGDDELNIVAWLEDDGSVDPDPDSVVITIYGDGDTILSTGSSLLPNSIGKFDVVISPTNIPQGSAKFVATQITSGGKTFRPTGTSFNILESNG